LEFLCIIWAKVWPTCTSENSKEGIIRFLAKESFMRCGILDDSGWKTINEKYGCEQCFIPKFERHAGMSKKRQSYFNDVSLFALSRPILLMCMGHET
jgi:hypothetical protein